MDRFDESSTLGVLVAAIIFCIGIGIHVYRIKKREYDLRKREEDSGSESSDEDNADEEGVDDEKEGQNIGDEAAVYNRSEFNHPWLVKNMRRHPGTVLKVEISTDGDYLATLCEGGAIVMRDLRNLKTPNKLKKYIVDISPDYACQLVWSPRPTYYLIHTVEDKRVCKYTLDINSKGTIVNSEKITHFDEVHRGDIVGFGVTFDLAYIMTCSSKNDLLIWNAAGEIVAKFLTGFTRTNVCKMCSFHNTIIAAGNAPVAKVFEIIYHKGVYNDVSLAFTMSGHTDEIYDVDFDWDFKQAVTISKDGTWRFYDIDIKYQTDEYPKLKQSGHYNVTENPPKIALTKKGDVLAVSVDSSVEFYNTRTGRLYNVAKNMFNDIINDMKFDSEGLYLYVCGGRDVKILHNVCAYQTMMDEVQEIIESQNPDVDRSSLSQTMEECKAALAKFGKRE